MRGIADKMEEHHNVRILDEAIIDCVILSHRYIAGRQLPDKSVSVLDTACAKVAIGQGATPAPVEDAVRRIQNLTSEINALEREQVTGAAHDERLEELKTKRSETEEELEKLNEQWAKEKDLVEKIRTIRTKLEATVSGEPSAVSSENIEAENGTATRRQRRKLHPLRAKAQRQQFRKNSSKRGNRNGAIGRRGISERRTEASD